MHKKRLLALAVMQLAGAHAVAQAVQTINIGSSIAHAGRLPYPPEVERRNQRAAWVKSNKNGRHK